jgi:hypothetical protein
MCKVKRHHISGNEINGWAHYNPGDGSTLEEAKARMVASVLSGDDLEEEIQGSIMDALPPPMAPWPRVEWPEEINAKPNLAGEVQNDGVYLGSSPLRRQEPVSTLQDHPLPLGGGHQHEYLSATIEDGTRMPGPGSDNSSRKQSAAAAATPEPILDRQPMKQGANVAKDPSRALAGATAPTNMDSVNARGDRRPHTAGRIDRALVQRFRESGPRESMKLLLEDFGGQDCFYELYSVLFSEYAVYVLTFSLVWFARDSPAIDTENAIKYLRHWLHTVRPKHASPMFCTSLTARIDDI